MNGLWAGIIHRMMRLTLALSTLTLITLGWAGTAKAHEIEPAVADVTVTADEVVIELRMALEPLVAGLDLGGLFDTNDSPLAAEHDALRALEPETLRGSLDAAWPRITEGMNLRAGETILIPEIVSVDIPEVGNVDLARTSELVIKAALPADGSPVTFGWIAAFGELIVRQAGAEDGYAALLPPGGSSIPLPRTGVAAQSAWGSFINYIAVGFDHIVPKGLDHILFVLGLFFFSTRMGPLLWQVTAFTVAHTITLALATLQIVSVPASVVEPLIALSIVYVAVENVMGGEHTGRRTVLVFGFGLLHGLGFASVLGEFGLASQFIASLIGFNVGVELGQLAVIAAAFLLVGFWFSRKDWYRADIAIPASVAIGLVGLYWSVERVFL